MSTRIEVTIRPEDSTTEYTASLITEIPVDQLEGYLLEAEYMRVEQYARKTIPYEVVERRVVKDTL